MIAALIHLAVVVAIPVMATGLLITAGGDRVAHALELLLPAREDQ